MRRRTLLLVGGCVAAGFVLQACAGSPSTLDPHADQASTIARLWWTMLVLGGIVFLAVVVYLAVALLRRGRRETTPLLDDGRGTGVVIGAGIVVPAIILVALFFLTLGTISALSADDAHETLAIQVIGHQWWWQVKYPSEGFATANEIHIPVGQPVELRLTTDDVIHSFWVPQLQRKMDLIPGQVNLLTVEADTAGIYRGQCAEYCGLQHANMAFQVIAQPAASFQAWMADQERVPPQPEDDLAQQGQQVFLGSACVYCHTIRGTNASGTIGPDLTHVASRNTLAAGTIPNTPGGLAGWIVDPQTIKPGNKMPPTQLSQPQLHELLVYLETLT
ncbi:MAG: cytochrome c oxidase subunit II [Actinomycetota bacterium]